MPVTEIGIRGRIGRIWNNSEFWKNNKQFHKVLSKVKVKVQIFYSSSPHDIWQWINPHCISFKWHLSYLHWNFVGLAHFHDFMQYSAGHNFWSVGTILVKNWNLAFFVDNNIPILKKYWDGGVFILTFFGWFDMEWPLVVIPNILVIHFHKRLFYILQMGWLSPFCVSLERLS